MRSNDSLTHWDALFGMTEDEVVTLFLAADWTTKMMI